MRIIAGKRRGLRLASVGKGDTAAHLRPTTDRVRENLFNTLQGGRFGDPVTEARVLDLFAGTGALGLEAWSRGAAHVSFVDNGAAAQALIRANTTAAGAEGETRLLRQDATRLRDCAGPPHDLVFIDPPYGRGLGTRTLEAARDGGWLSPEALIVCEDNSETEAPAGFRQLDSRRYGDTVVTLLRRASGPDADASP